MINGMFSTLCKTIVDRDNSVGVWTPYVLDALGIESRWGGGGRFSAPVPTGPGAHNWYRVFPGGKAAGAGGWSPTPIFSAEVLNTVELYLYPP